MVMATLVDWFCSSELIPPASFTQLQDMLTECRFLPRPVYVVLPVLLVLEAHWKRARGYRVD